MAPDGRQVAFLTHPTCTPPPPAGEHGGSAGAAMFNPNVLVVLALATGAKARTQTPDQGWPLVATSFSPDGRHVVTSYQGDGSLRVMPVAHPDFGTSKVVTPPRGCAYFGASWTTAGIDTVERCGQPPGLSPTKLVQLSAASVPLRSWPLAACVDGTDVVSDAAHAHVLIETDIGYGIGTCGQQWSTRIAAVDGAALRAVLDVPGSEHTLYLAGW